jgi:hypothetical protein
VRKAGKYRGRKERKKDAMRGKKALSPGCFGPS